MWQTGFRSLPQCVMSAVLRTAVWQPSFESAWIIWDGLSETSSFRIHRFCFTMSLVIGVASSAAFEKSATASAFNLFTAISGIWQRPTIAAISSAVSFFSIDPDGLPIPLSICKINAWQLKKRPPCDMCSGRQWHWHLKQMKVLCRYACKIHSTSISTSRAPCKSMARLRPMIALHTCCLWKTSL